MAARGCCCTCTTRDTSPGNTRRPGKWDGIRRSNWVVARATCSAIALSPMIEKKAVRMANKKHSSLGSEVPETPIADITENRHPPDSEKSWAENTLLPSLEKNPEKPIGTPSGINLDEHGRARFTTISGVPIRRLYTQADLPSDWNYEQYLGYPGEPPYTRGIHATGYRGKLFTMRQFSGFASPEAPNQRFK